MNRTAGADDCVLYMFPLSFLLNKYNDIPTRNPAIRLESGINIISQVDHWVCSASHLLRHQCRMSSLLRALL